MILVVVVRLVIRLVLGHRVVGVIVVVVVVVFSVVVMVVIRMVVVVIIVCMMVVVVIMSVVVVVLVVVVVVVSGEVVLMVLVAVVVVVLAGGVPGAVAEGLYNNHNSHPSLLNARESYQKIMYRVLHTLCPFSLIGCAGKEETSL